MRSRTPADLVGRCPRCYLPTRLCLCPELPRLDTRTELILIRHHKEKEKSTNTARIAALALARCQLRAYGSPGEPFDGPAALRDAKANGEQHGDEEPALEGFWHSPRQPRGQQRIESGCRDTASSEMRSEPI